MSSLSPGVLYIFRWRGKPVFMRILTQATSGLPPCPKLYDDVVALPVNPKGSYPPLGCRPRRFLAVADWIADIVDREQE